MNSLPILPIILLARVLLGSNLILHSKYQQKNPLAYKLKYVGPTLRYLLFFLCIALDLESQEHWYKELNPLALQVLVHYKVGFGSDPHAQHQASSNKYDHFLTVQPGPAWSKPLGITAFKGFLQLCNVMYV